MSNKIKPVRMTSRTYSADRTPLMELVMEYDGTGVNIIEKRFLASPEKLQMVQQVSQAMMNEELNRLYPGGEGYVFNES